MQINDRFTTVTPWRTGSQSWVQLVEALRGSELSLIGRSHYMFERSHLPEVRSNTEEYLARAIFS